MKRLLAILGSDVSRSLSPALHTRAAEACELDIGYVPVSCVDETHFCQAVDSLRVLGASGCNVTMPYKFAALDLCQHISNTAREIGAVNTLSFSEDGRIQGDNTDGPGLLRVLQTLPSDVLARVQILGGGGASRAAAWAVGQLSADVHVCARSSAAHVAVIAAGQSHPLKPIGGATLVISSLPPSADLADRTLLEWVDLGGSPVVCDLAYAAARQESPLVSLARARSLRAFDGRAMLVEQAALSLSLWTGGEVSRIRAAMLGVVNLPVDGPLT